MNKRKNIFCLLLMALVSCFIIGCTNTVTHVATTVAGAAASVVNGTLPVSNLRQVIVQDAGTGRTIMWQSDKELQEAAVEYGLKDQNTVEKVAAQGEKFTDDKVTTYIYTARIADLQPGQTYRYRALAGKKATDWQELNTPKGTSFKALIFPDSQSSDYTDWQKMARFAWEQNKDAQFFVNMGDLVDNGEDHNQWNYWFEAVDKMIARIPVVTLMGNHETYNLDWKVRRPEAYLHLFALPKVEPAAYQNQFYSFDYGDIHFTVLNTQDNELKDFEPDMMAAQIAWLKKDLAQTKKKWKIVLMHKDVLQYGFLTRPTPRAEGISEEGKIFMPIFDENKVDVVLTAHLHTYRNRGHIRNFEHNDQGPLYILTGVAGNVRYPSLWKTHHLDIAKAPQPETDNFMVMDANADSITFTAYLPDGKEIDKVEVKK
jgi:phosphodiesterase/alkaline phosphatase D-like protein